MSQSTSASVTLSHGDMRLVRLLRDRLRLKSDADVIRRALRLLRRTTDRDALFDTYRIASLTTRSSTGEAVRALDRLADEGLAEL